MGGKYWWEVGVAKKWWKVGLGNGSYKGEVVHYKREVVHYKGEVVHYKGEVVYYKGEAVHDKVDAVHYKGDVNCNGDAVNCKGYATNYKLDAVINSGPRKAFETKETFVDKWKESSSFPPEINPRLFYSVEIHSPGSPR